MCAVRLPESFLLTISRCWWRVEPSLASFKICDRKTIMPKSQHRLCSWNVTGLLCALGAPLIGLVGESSARASDATLTYTNQLTRIKHPKPLLADQAEWVEPIRETNRWEAPAIVNDPGADLHVRAWRWTYNGRGIIEMPNHLRAIQTAIIMVHPWGID